MSDRITPGSGGSSSPLARRIAAAERFIGQFQASKILAHDAQGNPKIFNALSMGDTPGKEVLPEPGAFGGIIEYTENGRRKTGIIGGTVQAGDKNWEVKPQELNLAADGEWNVYITVAVKAWVMDGLIVPGLETSSKPEWGKTTGAIPDQEIPTAPSGNGKAVVSIGRLKIKNNKATLQAQGKGEIVITAWAGTLSHLTRTA